MYGKNFEIYRIAIHILINQNICDNPEDNDDKKKVIQLPQMESYTSCAKTYAVSPCSRVLARNLLAKEALKCRNGVFHFV